ncbi:regulatory protein RecX [Ruminiclostridium herbifermentans]|uniref:Regulatory protein RecX n=1 Tax=Ruminiclostridium herbifermentans TaxID=2488810 RepID=A0A4V6EPZ0_9FIRM|nr:regulatory protein RecX [Ruminiclostridium herbifermentans]QNU65390.1 regulatory protein RecX [Ruminiclostridium herbifermentans]
MIITSIEVNKNISSMAEVFVDDTISFCLPQKRIKALDLYKGKDITPETLEFIMDYEVLDAAKSCAVKFLSFKLRTASEVYQKLFELGYKEEIINKVIDSLIEIDYINDYKYAIKYIREKTKLQPKSIKMLSMELSYKGIAEETIEQAFNEINLDEDSIAYKLLEKKFSKIISYNEKTFDEKTLQKMKSFLANRGFSYSQISRVMSKFLPDEYFEDC